MKTLFGQIAPCLGLLAFVSFLIYKNFEYSVGMGSKFRNLLKQIFRIIYIVSIVTFVFLSLVGILVEIV